MVTQNNEFAAKTILVVDDDDTFRRRLIRALEQRGFEAAGAADAREAIDLATAGTPELALVDLHLPDQSGLAVVRRLHELDASTGIVVLTGYGNIATAVESLRAGATHYLTKPADLDQILAAFAHDGGPPATLTEDNVPSLARMGQEHIARVLELCHGNITHAATTLRMHRRSLQRKLARIQQDFREDPLHGEGGG